MKAKKFVKAEEIKIKKMGNKITKYHFSVSISNTFGTKIFSGNKLIVKHEISI